MAHMLIMSARQFRDPVLEFVEMEAGDGLIHAFIAF